MSTACAEARLNPASAARVRLAAAEGPIRYLSGPAADMTPMLHGPALLLAGGGSDVVEGMQWQIDQARGCSDCPTKLDMVVLRASGADGYNSMLSEFRGVDSIESMVFSNRASADSAAVYQTVARAEAIFFAGGDQCLYMKYFKGTAVEKAVREVYARGGSVGGTSAGLAIQGSTVYDACSGSVTTPEALKNPFDPAISFSSGLFAWPAMQQTITDTHFSQRDRMGRLLAFLARQQAAGAPRTRGLAVDEATSVGVDARGQARVFGAHQAYVVEADHKPEICVPGRPLSYSGYRVWKFNPGNVFDLAHLLPDQAYSLNVDNGQIQPGSTR
ncbi:MAG: cyanophycinase [Candidatus Sericytochromatia bacterium]